MQPVGQLDHQHPQVAAAGDDHLPERLGLGVVAEADLVQLGHPVDEVRDLEAEVLLGPRERVAGVLDRVVQQRGGESGGVQAEIGEDHRDRERVGDERLAGLAALAAVLLLGDGVGPFERRHVGVGVLLHVHADQRGQGAAGGRQPSPRADPAAQHTAYPAVQRKMLVPRRLPRPGGRGGGPADTRAGPGSGCRRDR